MREFLAHWQRALTELRAKLTKWPASEALGLPEFDCRFIASLGDRQKQLSLLHGEAPDDLFTRELDQAILRGEADWALHSAKDLPLLLADGLKLWCLLPQSPEGADSAADIQQTDSLVSRDNLSLAELRPGALVGTSSPGRREQLLARRPDLQIVSLRGTIGERLARLEPGPDALDAIIVATCALQRLGLATGRILPPELLAVHPMQGYLALVGAGEVPAEFIPVLEHLDVRRRWGSVTLLGAGAGDPGLLTLEGRRVLQQADIVFYDALVSKDLLELAPPQAEKIYVGKRRNAHSMPQDQISRQLWLRAREGRQVLRLKGGDALLFARAAEELQALREACVHYRVLPGISAAFAAAASLALPLTRRGDNDEGSSLHLLSAYPPERINFRQLPPGGNIIFYMGLAQRREIRRCALEAGRSEQEPVLLVLWASLPQQQNIYSTLGELPELELEAKAAGLILLGPIARPAQAAPPASRLPDLAGKTWITGLNPAMDPETPAELVWHLPLLELRPHFAPGAVPGELATALERADLLLFTSKHAVRYFFACLENISTEADCPYADLRLLGGKRIVSIGEATSCELERFHLRLREPWDWQSPQESSRGLLREFERRAASQNMRERLRDQHILIPSSSKALPTLTEGLPRCGGHSVERVVLYDNRLSPALRGPGSPFAFLAAPLSSEKSPDKQRTVPFPGDWDTEWAQLRGLRAVYLSSPSTAEYFAELVALPLQRRFGAGFPDWWQYRCKGEPTQRRLAELQDRYGLLAASMTPTVP